MPEKEEPRECGCLRQPGFSPHSIVCLTNQSEADEQGEQSSGNENEEQPALGDRSKDSSDPDCGRNAADVQFISGSTTHIDLREVVS
jgi:hypothetical protein